MFSGNPGILRSVTSMSFKTCRGLRGALPPAFTRGVDKISDFVRGEHHHFLREAPPVTSLRTGDSPLLKAGAESGCAAAVRQYP